MITTIEQIKDYLAEQGLEDTVILDHPATESAFMGLSESNRAIYDYFLMVDEFMVLGSLSFEEAVEEVDSLVDSYADKGPNSPIFLMRHFK